MEQRLTAETQALEQRLKAEQQASEQRLMEFMRQVSAALMAQFDAKLHSEIAAAEARAQEFTRDSQSELLRAFEKFAQRTEARLIASRMLAHDALMSVEETRDRLKEKGLL
ncbi:MAG: hypothetical protein SFV51_17520 [Bryobacteraceae bacterium]|nr:hypothetical protein [Bryobacteraceae bacterium]